MRKFTLLLAASAFAISGLAQVSPSGFAGMCKKMYGGEKYVVGGTYQVTKNTNRVLSPATYAERPVNVSMLRENSPKREAPAGAKIFTNWNGLTATELGDNEVWSATMQNSYYYESDGKVYVNFYGDFSVDCIEGTITERAENGICLVTFKDGQTVGSLTDGTPLKIYSCKPTLIDEDNYIYEFPLAGTDIELYYWPEYQMLYLPGVIGLFVDGAQPLLYENYVISAEMLTVDYFSQFMRKATVSGNICSNDLSEGIDPKVSQEAVAINFEEQDADGNVTTGWYVKSGDFFIPERWIRVDIPVVNNVESPRIRATQYLGYYRFSKGTEGNVITMMIDPDFTQWWNWIDLSSSTDIDGNVTYTCTEGHYTDLVITESQSTSGRAAAYTDYKLYISNEQASGIRGVEDNANSVQAKEYFDLSGRKVGSEAKGLVIEKVRYANGTSVSRKVVK